MEYKEIKVYYYFTNKKGFRVAGEFEGKNKTEEEVIEKLINKCIKLERKNIHIIKIAKVTHDYVDLWSMYPILYRGMDTDEGVIKWKKEEKKRVQKYWIDYYRKRDEEILKEREKIKLNSMYGKFGGNK